MSEPEFSPQVERFLRRASRRLPKVHRAQHEQTWRTEMRYMATPEEQLDFIRDLQAGLSALCRELDPEWAYMQQLFKGTTLTSLGCLLLSFRGVAPATLQLVAFTLCAGLGVLAFSHLTTKCLLVMREVRRVWWRLGLNLLLTVFCGYVALADLAWWSALHPQVFLMMVLAVVLGIRTARRFHRPRPVLSR